MGFSAEGSVAAGPIDAKVSCSCKMTSNNAGGCSMSGSAEFGNSSVDSDGKIGADIGGGPVRVGVSISPKDYIISTIGNLLDAVREFRETLRIVQSASSP